MGKGGFPYMPASCEQSRGADHDTPDDLEGGGRRMRAGFQRGRGREKGQIWMTNARRRGSLFLRLDYVTLF